MMYEATIREYPSPTTDASPPNPWQRLRRRFSARRDLDRMIRDFMDEASSASTRAEIHSILVRRARELTGALRIEWRPVGGPRRVCETAGARNARGSRQARIPVTYREKPIGWLTLTLPGRRLPQRRIEALAAIASVAALAERLVASRRELERSLASVGPDAVQPTLMPFLRQLILLARRRREPLSLLAIGIGEDRGIGDLLGDRSVGDAIAGVADCAASRLRESDLILRYDEGTLIAILPNAGARDVPSITDSLMRPPAERPASSPMAAAPEFSIGASIFPDDASEPDLLVDAALNALARARSRGSGAVALADEGPIRGPEAIGMVATSTS